MATLSEKCARDSDEGLSFRLPPALGGTAPGPTVPPRPCSSPSPTVPAPMSHRAPGVRTNAQVFARFFASRIFWAFSIHGFGPPRS